MRAPVLTLALLSTLVAGLAAQPLNITGAVGSPVNPVAIK